MVAVSRTGPAPSAKHLRHWEAVCRFIDAQPYRAVWYPYPFGDGDPPMTTRLLTRMAQFGLVRHGQDCCWKLTQRWQQIMRRLWRGVAAEDDTPPLLLAPGQGDPFLVDLGVDTFYISLKADELPTSLLMQCSDLKALAQTHDTSVETPWLWFGAPLSMYKSGVGTKEHGKGASWGYILRNDEVMLLLRKTALNDIVGSVRLSAHALWTNGPRGALDGMKSALRRMWGDPKDFKTLAYQVSEIHLCVDIAHFAPKPDDLNRLVTRARVVQVHVPSDDEEAGITSAWDGNEDGLDAWDEPDVPDDWADVPVDDELDGFDDDDDAEDDEETDPPEGEQLAEHEGASIHLWGQRASGMTFAQKGALSVIFYDKALQERQAGIKLAWSRRIHEAGGWDGRSPLTRIEARFKREILRELALAFGGKSARWADDPWEILDHLHDLWAYFAGVPPEQDQVPDVTGLGWMRLTLPDGDDMRKRRWQTDPFWHVVQRAPFSTLPPVMLKRQKHHHHHLDTIDAEIYGFLKLRAAHRGEYLGHTVTLSQELHAFHDRMEEIDEDKGRDFAEEVREKARLLGKPVPMRPLSTLPPISERPKQTRKGKQNAS